MDDHEVNTPETPATPQKFEFFGSYEHSLDSKGRIIIPNAYRPQLGSVFTIGPTRAFDGVALYPDPVFERLLNEFSAMRQRLPAVQQYTAQFFKLSYRGMEPDAQGRLLLPMKLRQRMLKEEKELEISGDYDHVRIVGMSAANAEDESFAANLGAILNALAGLDE